jgi:hypothetical protein
MMLNTFTMFGELKIFFVDVNIYGQLRTFEEVIYLCKDVNLCKNV